MNWRNTSVVLQVISALYLQIGEWVSLPPWNDLSHGNGQESLDVAIAAAQAILVFGFIKRIRWLMGIGIGFYASWLVLQIQSWWIPYVFGASEHHMKFYQHWFGHTYKFLPTYGNHPAPDALHLILQLLILAVVVTAALAFLQINRTSPENVNGRFDKSAYVDYGT